MKKFSNWFFVVFVVLAALAGVYVSTQFRDREAGAGSATQIDSAIAYFFATQLNDVNGVPQSLAQWKNRVLVINFWASWCPPCREEMPSFSRLYTKYAASGVQFVGIALDSAENVQSFAAEESIAYPLLVGEASGVELARGLGNATLALPYTLILTPAGAPYFTRLGRLSEQDLDTELQKQLRRKTP